MRIRTLLLVGIAILTGCRPPTIENLITPEDDEFAKEYLGILARGDLERAEAMLDQQLRGEETHAKFQEMAAMLSRGDPDFIEPIGVHVQVSPTSRSVNISYQVRYGGDWFTTNVARVNQDGKVTVHGVSVHLSPGDLRELNRFTLQRTMVTHWGVMLLALLSASLSVAAAVAAFRSTLRRRWAWAALALVGVGTIQLNWTTGGVGILPLQFVLLGASFARASEFSPWLVWAAFPLGAVMTWRRLRAHSAVVAVGDSPKPGPDSGHGQLA